MAKARCYTKSGNVEKYESNCFSGTALHRPIVFKAELVGPNSDGNYTITYEGYDDGNSSNYDCYCKTIYGPDWRHNKGEIKTFYFIKKTPSVTTITFKLSSINTRGYINITCSVSHPLETNVTCVIERIAGNGIKRGYSLTYEKSNEMGGYQQFYVTEKPSRDDTYTIVSVYPTESEKFKYKGYFLGIRVS